jgi:F-type H+-transporting ATPase subunit c
MAKIKTPLLTLLLLLAAAGPLMAAADPETFAYFRWLAIVAGLGMPIAVIGPAIAQGLATKGACEGIARNPEANTKITTVLVIGLAMIESLAIYALVIELILLFANPSLKHLGF